MLQLNNQITNNEPNHYIYMRGKLSQAIHRLAIGEGDIRSRLNWAGEYLNMVDYSMLPIEIQDQWILIWQLLNIYPAESDKSSFQITLQRIRNSTGSKIAVKIVNLHNDLESYC